MTQRTAFLLAAGWLLAGCIATQATEPNVIQKTYPVADLVIPFDSANPSPDRNADGPARPWSSAPLEGPKPATLEAHLMRLIVASVAPQSWAEAGGKGTIDYFPLGMALVVNQSAEVHEQIAAMLELLRRNAGKEVGVEVRVVSISEEMAKELQARHDIDCFRCGKDQTAEPQVSCMDDREVFQLLEMLEGDRTAEVLQSPRLTVFNGQVASCQVMDYQWFVTNVRTVENGGQVAFVPENNPVPLGWNFHVQPVLSADGKVVRAQLDMTFTTMASSAVPLFPITTFITPTFEGGAQGQPIPFTQYIQQPTVSTWTLDQVVNVPMGSTAVLSGWKVERESRWEGPPVLSQIPYVKDLFRLFTTCREPRYMLVLVTPRVVESSEASEKAEAAPMPKPMAMEAAARACPPPAPAFCPMPEHAEWGWCMPAVNSIVQPIKYEAPDCPAPAPKANFLAEVRKEMAALLVRKYQQACQQGLMAEAKAIAEEAVELDPACFCPPGTIGEECK